MWRLVLLLAVTHAINAIPTAGSKLSSMRAVSTPASRKENAAWADIAADVLEETGLSDSKGTSPSSSKTSPIARAAVLAESKKRRAVTTATTSGGECKCCNEMGKLEVLIPFYYKDVCAMRLVANGFAKHGDPSGFGRIQLMWVSNKPKDEHQGQIDAAMGVLKDAGFDAQLSKFELPEGMGGWEAQQLAKLSPAKAIQSEFYVILDTKNAPIRPFSRETFLRSNGRGMLVMDTPLDKLQPECDRTWLMESAKTLGVHLPHDALVHQSHTPFVMHTETVRRMIPEVQKATGTSLAAALSSNRQGTEFGLYNVFVRSHGNDLTCMHEPLDHSISYVHWGNRSFKELEAVRDGRDKRIVFFGPQQSRTKWDEFPDEKERTHTVYKQIYMKYGLLNGNEEWFKPESCVEVKKDVK